MTKKIIFFLFLFDVGLAFDITEIASSEDIFHDSVEIVSSLGLNCGTPNNWPIAAKEIGSILIGFSRVIVESSQILLYKKDFPNVCHMLTKNIIASEEYGLKEESAKSTDRPCVLKGFAGGCLLRKSITTEKISPSYYWPKYLIEVSEKGNDSHESFAAGNFLYSLNRKISAILTQAISSSEIPSTLVGLLELSKPLLKAIGLDLGEMKVADFIKLTPLQELQKLRIRSTKEKNNTTFDVNVWPVALSDTVATHLAVCGPDLVASGGDAGGYAWPIKGVPMTCPIAMSVDAYMYWDTGLLDYLDPEAITAMAAATNPLSCFASWSADMLLEEKMETEKLGDQSGVKKLTQSLPDQIKGAFSTCSFPILGNTEAISKKSMSLASLSKWKQVKCTPWGPLAPRVSSSFSSDYNFANSALKFKLLAHELFGLKRGAKERWNLVYPWEDSAVSIFSALPATITEGLSKIGIKDDFIKGGRSVHELYPAGDPRLIDVSVSSKEFFDRILGLGKEMAYLGSLYGLGSLAVSSVDSMTKEQKNEIQKSSNYQEQKKIYSDEIDKSENNSDARQLGKEPVFSKKTKCTYSINGRIYKVLENSDFNTCFNSIHSYGCPFGGSEDNGDCVPFRVDVNFSEKMVVTSYKTTNKPKVKHYTQICSESSQNVSYIHSVERRTPGRDPHWIPEETPKHHYVKNHKHCYPILASEHQTEMRQFVQRPDENNIENIVKNNETKIALKTAALAGPWIGAEIARNKFAQITGKNFIGGKKRIYGIWEKIQCGGKKTKTTVRADGSPISVVQYESCQDAIRYEAIKLVQKKYIRKFCDLLGYSEGKPWKN